MSEIKCNFCGGSRYEERHVDYLYSRDGKYLLVPGTPVQVCLDCGMSYYAAAVLKEIERHFFAVHAREEQPDSYIEIPTKRLAATGQK